MISSRGMAGKWGFTAGSPTAIEPAIQPSSMAPSVMTTGKRSISLMMNWLPQTIRGTLTRVEWVNPHSWIYVDVPDGEGVETWAVETGSIARMEKGGLFKTELRPGMEVVIMGFAARNDVRQIAGFAMIVPGRQATFLLGRQ